MTGPVIKLVETQKSLTRELEVVGGGVHVGVVYPVPQQQYSTQCRDRLKLCANLSNHYKVLPAGLEVVVVGAHESDEYGDPVLQPLLHDPVLGLHGLPGPSQ